MKQKSAPDLVVFARSADGTLWTMSRGGGRSDEETRSAFRPGGAVLLSAVAYGVKEDRIDADRLLDPSIVFRWREGRTYVDAGYLRRLRPEDRVRIDRQVDATRRAATYFLIHASDMMRGIKSYLELEREENVWKSSDRL
jgi:hypothetical protein